ncbi:carbohydrate-binding domain-containing protein [Microbacterium sp. JZ101]
MNTEPRRSARTARVGLGLAFALAVAAVTGCSAIASAATDTAAGSTSDSSSASSSTASSASTAEVASVTAVSDANADQTVVNDDEWSADDAVDIALSGTEATTDAPGVTVADGTVTISEAGVYRLSGDYTGSIVVAAPDDAQVVLILDGATIAAAHAPAIQVTTADDVALFLAEGSTNAVASTGAYSADAGANAAIWADTDLTISGTGALTVEGEAEDGIASKDDLVILSGQITVTAADDGLKGNDSLTVRDGRITVDAGGDGLASDQDADETQGYVEIEGGTLDITAGSDGIDGYTDIVITGGDIAISAEEGIEAGTIAIGGGVIDITATDDGINGSAGSSSDTASGEEMQGGMGGGGMQDSGELVLIAGGEITIDSDGDGLDSNGSMEITGGTTVVYGPTSSGNGALDTNGSLTISGGTVLALDSGGMSGSPATESAQAWVAASASGAAGSTVEIVAEDGTVLFSTTAEKDFGAVVFSSADVVSGASYDISVDGASVATATTGQALAGGMGGGGMGGPGGGRG